MIAAATAAFAVLSIMGNERQRFMRDAAARRQNARVAVPTPEATSPSAAPANDSNPTSRQQRSV